MQRLAEKQIAGWRDSSRRKPLIIRGARQVGKTWLVENVLAKQFTSFVKIDLEKRRDLHPHFAGNLEPQSILSHLELTTGRIIPGQTLLFFDEIQACPRALMALRYFHEEMPELHVVAAGSLLEFAFGKISIPVGRVQYLYMHPMTFYEYLLAMDKEQMAEYTLNRPDDVAGSIQEIILRELRSYFFVGGMPECVKTYRDSASMLETFQVQSEILDSYRDDFSKYTPQVNTICLDAVFLNVAKSIGEQLKYTRLNDGHSSQMNRKAFDLLVKAKVVHKIPACNPSGLPLGATANPKKFKASMLDIGLMQRLCQLPVELELQQENLLAMYRGKLAEQFVAQELLAWHSSELFYWAREARGSSAEIDFLVVRDGNIYPVEVKSGAGGSLRSLHLMLGKYTHCPQGLVLYSGTSKKLPEQKLQFLPLYCVATIGDQRPAVV
ncbi:MAG: ATP-binding protein [Desulfobulbaceae bacterium]|uniref:ATP-binding protein n=1 Tax=Candidatus Desulfatifera sulfidica TaxID=2841691 RepID=A0A8J6TE16_9BACT|nr:ATP-binding protein [Candidatus Desulfatifera sulfidica]